MLNELTQFSDLEIGRQIATLTNNHVLDSGIDCIDIDGEFIKCEQLCASLDDIAKVEKKVSPAIINFDELGEAMSQVIFISVFMSQNVALHHFVTMSARRRAIACLLALKKKSILTEKNVSNIS